MRVIYLHQYFNTPDMSGGTRSYEMARRLVGAGHQVDMVTTFRDPIDSDGWFATDEAGITVHWLPVPYSNKMGFWPRIRAFLRFAIAASRKAATLDGDVIFATSTPLTVAIPAIIASFWKGIPMVFEVRDLWPDVPVALGVIKNPIAIRAAYFLERIAYRRAARVVALAPGMKETIVTRGVPRDAVAVIPNGCDFDIFDVKNASPPKHPAINPGDHLMVYAGTIGGVNGVDFIPRLAHEIERQSSDRPIHFVIFGDGALRTQAESVAASFGVLDRTVHFMGARSKHEVARWIGAAAATIITYDGPEIVFRDSVSNKFFDSIAAGKPVIANYVGFATQTAAAAGAGFTISRDPRKAAAEVLRLYADPAILVDAGRRAATLARDRFSRDSLASELEQLLVDVVETRARKVRGLVRDC